MKQPETSYDLPTVATTETITPEQHQAAARTCTHYAKDTDELRDFLEMIGWLHYQPGRKRRT